MAQDPQNTSSQKGASFNRGLIMDVNESSIPEGAYTRARNATEYTVTGDLNTRSNEPSNLLCVTFPYPCIGTIHLYGDVWAVYLTDDTNSEIGIFDDSECSYTPIKNSLGQVMNPSNCLGFNRKYLIKGVSKQNFDCSYQTYWDDGNAPTRTININSPAFLENCNTINNCITCTPTTDLDCEELRLARFVKNPCISITRGHNGGNLPNGSYFVVIGYTINDQRVTDYSTPSNIQSIFEHENLSGSLNITINSIDTEHFDEFELVVVRTINQQTSAKRIGIYSTRTNQIFLDQIAESLPSIPIELIPFRSPVYDKSEAVFETGTYMLRVAPTTKFDFNYQPLANRITTKWISVKYPADYYRKGGNVTSYLRDEVYPFFIRWVYNTGDKSSSYHIPGREATATDLLPATAGNDKLFPDEDVRWKIYNTATGNTIPNIILPDGGVIIGEGLMSYWESTEIYPDNKPDIWNQSNPPAGPDTSHVDSSGISWSLLPGDMPVNLCGKPIRHHKMPDNLSVPNVTEHFKKDATGNIEIRVLGVQFDKIRAPRDNHGNLIPGIVGYEILRGSREGNKTIIAKGMINNMKTYSLSPSTKQGLYPNYPYNPINATVSNPDPTLSPQDQSDNGGLGALKTPLLYFGNASRSAYTFHSPDTQFKNPFLSAKEIKLYGEINGIVLGNFEEVPEHPKEKLLGDLSFLLAAILGLASAALAVRGQRTRTYQAPQSSTTSFIAPVIGGFDPGLITAPIALGAYASLTQGVITPTSMTLLNVLADAVGLPNTDTALIAAGYTAGALPGLTAGTTTESVELATSDYLGPITKALTGLVTLGYYWTLGTDTALRLIESLVPYRQYAYRYRSHGFYDNFSAGNAVPGNTRRLITSANYLDNQFQDFGSNYRINNLYRGRAVAIEIDPTKAISYPLGSDNTVQSISTAALLGTGAITLKDPDKEFTTVTTTYYAALKVRIENQYGQMTSIQEIPITCVFDSIDPVTEEQLLTDQATPPIFGGDTYITRYTEKNTFFYFYDWLLGQPDGTEFNYRLKYMVNFPRYWADFTKYETGEFLTGFLNFITPGPAFLSINSLTEGLPSGRANLDRISNGSSVLSNIFGALRFGLKDAYFYLFQSGVRDFFVESEINTELRDWGNEDSERHYDPYRYTDTAALFAPKIIKAGNFFKYDISLSISRLFINFISWGNQQPRDYDPIIAEKCFSYFPFRAIYSLPQNLENKKDYWRVFLANNYKDFKSKITAIKPINKSGALILFDTASPIEFQGVDTLQTSLGTKITIGDGGLFSQPLQSVSNADDSLEYGSCQNRLSILNTPFGLYYISENQGKVFRLTQGLKDITFSGLKFWFKKYLPYFLTQDIPNYPHTDNPVIGIGCQSIYDNQLETIYFCKKDYKVRDQYKGQIIYNEVSSSLVLISGNDTQDIVFTPIQLTDTQYFEDASWTVSYSPKANNGDGGWVSHHDWHPELYIPSKNNFMSIITNPITKKGEVWRHNNRTDSFCNYYGTDYPFELEYVTSTGTIVNTVRSLEYYLECYKYDLSGINKYQLLDFNFDQAIISNTEQTSGVLKLNLTPKNNPIKGLLYPIINPTDIDILYSKVEQKYRFNTFWDITDDRGEFSAAQRVIWLNDANGYTRTLNPLNLNYQKNSFERKKFRHYLNYVSLQRKISGDVKMIVKIAITKLLESKR